jgi:8-oxo-dGTP pyrophosphatase MutT (NUDIX family)
MLSVLGGPSAQSPLGTRNEPIPRKRIGAGVLIVDQSGSVLLVQPTYKEHWEVPGGLVEADESPSDAARREVVEELGVDVQVDELLVVDWVPPDPLLGDGLMFLYSTAGIDASAIELPHQELASWAWSDDLALDLRLPPPLARRVRAGLSARISGTVAELVDGFPRYAQRHD